MRSDITVKPHKLMSSSLAHVKVHMSDDTHACTHSSSAGTRNEDEFFSGSQENVREHSKLRIELQKHGSELRVTLISFCGPGTTSNKLSVHQPEERRR